MPINLGDALARHPDFDSLETLEDRLEPVNVFSYQRFKFKLYKLASPIIGDIYFHRSSSIQVVTEKVAAINAQLVDWSKSLPPELRHSSDGSESTSPEAGTPATSVKRTFELQALALQLAYDNIQILLHRPLLSYNLKIAIEPDEIQERGPSKSPQRDVPTGYNTPRLNSKAFALSKAQCWESALRTSRLSSRGKILRAAHYTHAATYIGIHLFTAGMVLSIAALSKPLSTQAQEAKQAIARIVRMSDSLGHLSILSAQSGKILQDLVRLILDREMKSIFSENGQKNEKSKATRIALSNSPGAAAPTHDSGAPDRSGNGLDRGRNGDAAAASFHARDYEGGLPPENRSDQTSYELFDSPNFMYPQRMDFNEGVISLQEGTVLQ